MDKTALAKKVVVALALGLPEFKELLEKTVPGQVEPWQNWGKSCGMSPQELSKTLYISDKGGGFPLKSLNCDQNAMNLVKSSLLVNGDAIQVPMENIMWLETNLVWDEKVLALGELVVPPIKVEIKSTQPAAAPAAPAAKTLPPAASAKPTPVAAAPTAPTAGVDVTAIQNQITILQGAIPAMGGAGSPGAAGIEAQIAALEAQLPKEVEISETERWATENNVALTTTLADVIAATEGPLAHLKELCETMLSPVTA